MIDKRTVFEIHRLKNAGMSNRVIAGELQLNRETVSRYLKDPNPLPMQRKEKPSKLDPYRDLAGQIIEEHPAVKARLSCRLSRQKALMARSLLSGNCCGNSGADRADGKRLSEWNRNRAGRCR